MYYGILSDVFDGIIARKLKVSTDSFRIADTIIDLLFYLSILGFIWCNFPASIVDNLFFIAGIFGLELLMYLTCFFRFSKLPSPHAILSKFWGIYIVVEFTLILLNISGFHFRMALILGLIVHLDRLLIYILLPKWEHDIPSSYHSLLIRRGKPIKRRKLFNG